MMALVHRQISLTFILGQGVFGESGTDTVKLAGQLRASVEIQASGSIATQAHIVAHGMTLSKINQLSTLGISVTAVRRNQVIVEAGDANGMATVFQGQIVDAIVDASGMPEIGFVVTALGGYLQQIKPVPPTSYNGLANVAVIMKGLADQAGFGFQNFGVTAQLIDPYFPGTSVDQIRSCAAASNTEWIIDDDVLAIWPRGGARGETIATISSDTGMIGYPSFSQSAIILNTLYDPQIRYGQKIQVKSSLTGANGLWQIQQISHYLQSESPNGKWESRITAIPPELFVRGGVVISGS